MATYYVLSVDIPSGRGTSAEVDAPDSRHARTAFLDYLSRNGMLQWGERQAARRLIIAKRMKPGEIKTDIRLDYGVREAKTEELPPPVQETSEESQQPKDAYGPPGPQEGKVQDREFGRYYRPTGEQKWTAQPTRDMFAGSPIVKLSRKMGGF